MTALAHAVPAQIQFHQAHLDRQKRLKAAAPKRPTVRVTTVMERHDAHEKAHYAHLRRFVAYTKRQKAMASRTDDVKTGAKIVEIKKAFFDVCPYTERELFSFRRKPEVVAWRFALAHVLYNETAASYPRIGRAVGGRDHTTIIHNVRKVDEAIAAKNVDERKLVTGHTIYIRRKAG